MAESREMWDPRATAVDALAYYVTRDPAYLKGHEHEPARSGTERHGPKKSPKPSYNSHLDSSEPANETHKVSHVSDPSKQQKKLPNSAPTTNIWPVLLTFEDTSQVFDGKVLFDTGASDNWIGMDVVQGLHLAVTPDPNREEALDWNGNPVYSLGIVHARWTYCRQMIPVTFRIAHQTPVDTIFGFPFLFQRRILSLNQEPTAPGTVHTLAPPRRSGNKSAEKQTIEQKREQIARTDDDIARYQQWRKDMIQDGWKWHAQKQNFYRETSAGFEWSRTKPNIDFFLGDHLQSDSESMKSTSFNSTRRNQSSR